MGSLLLSSVLWLSSAAQAEAAAPVAQPQPAPASPTARSSEPAASPTVNTPPRFKRSPYPLMAGGVVSLGAGLALLGGSLITGLTGAVIMVVVAVLTMNLDKGKMDLEEETWKDRRPNWKPFLWKWSTYAVIAAMGALGLGVLHTAVGVASLAASPLALQE